MANNPDMSFDIDALFDHLTNNLNHDLKDDKDWCFSLRSSDPAALEEVGNELANEFMVQLQETVEHIDADGNSSFGDPLLSVVHRGALTSSEVKTIADRIRSIADQRGLVYEGVDCYEPIDEDELLGWFAPEDAAWRLRHISDSGLEEDASLPWTFLVVTPDFDSANNAANDLTANGFNDLEHFDEPDEEGHHGQCVFVAGRNNEAALTETSTKIAKIAEHHGGRLEGIQFYTREQVYEIFGGD